MKLASVLVFVAALAVATAADETPTRNLRVAKQQQHASPKMEATMSYQRCVAKFGAARCDHFLKMEASNTQHQAAPKMETTHQNAAQMADEKAIFKGLSKPTCEPGCPDCRTIMIGTIWIPLCKRPKAMEAAHTNVHDIHAKTASGYPNVHA